MAGCTVSGSFSTHTRTSLGEGSDTSDAHWREAARHINRTQKTLKVSSSSVNSHPTLQSPNTLTSLQCIRTHAQTIDMLHATSSNCCSLTFAGRAHSTRSRCLHSQCSIFSAPVDMLEGYFAHPTFKGSPIGLCNLGHVLELKRDGLLQCRRFVSQNQARCGEPEQTQGVHRILNPKPYKVLGLGFWGLPSGFVCQTLVVLPKCCSNTKYLLCLTAVITVMVNMRVSRRAMITVRVTTRPRL